LDSTPALAVLKRTEQPSLVRRLARRLDAKFVLIVLLPTLLAATYYGLVASDVYISESRFVVRNPQRPSATGLGALLQGTGFSRSQDDTYAVHDFMLSRDALQELQQKFDLRSVYSRTSIDSVNRFPGLIQDGSFEAFYRYYQDHIFIGYDSVSSITTLQVRAFSGEDAKAINEQLVEMGERLLNNMNIRSRQDLIRVAEQEVTVAEERAKTAGGALAAFRADRSILDPDRQSTFQMQGVAKMREDLMAAESQLVELRQVSPRNPQIPSLESRIASLRKGIADENALVLGRVGGLMSKSPAYDRLMLEKGFADRQLGAALGALDTARSEAARKQLYLERLVQPNLADKALEPRRIRGVATVLAVGLILWGIVSLVVASVREHTA
jgi:capsular polysaccharide transport system permease protein